MREWLLKPRIWFGAEPSPPRPPIVLAPADDGPDPDNAARAARAMHAAPKVADVRPEDHPQAGQFERRVPVPTPSGIAPDCPGCAGRDRVIRERENELKDLRRRLAAYELDATRQQQLQPSEQLT